MSALTFGDRQILEKAFGMSTGYVLNFSDRTFNEFVHEATGQDIYGGRFSAGGTSKAKHLREFWQLETDSSVAQLTAAMRDCGAGLQLIDGATLTAIDGILARLGNAGADADLDALRPNVKEQTFDLLAKAARKSIDDGRPEEGLDRLHTFLTKFLRVVCERRGISVPRDKPLHSLMGEYVKALRSADELKSAMTERILKASISSLEAFNDVRNDQSLAHDNIILNSHEALYIFNHVASLVRLLQVIERGTARVPIE